MRGNIRRGGRIVQDLLSGNVHVDGFCTRVLQNGLRNLGSKIFLSL